MRKILWAVALLGYSVVSSADNAVMPVMVGGEADLDACSSVGVVSGLAPRGDGFLAVRTGANASYKLVDKLLEGQQVLMCNTSADGKWYGIVYAQGNKDLDCGLSSPISPEQPYQGKCKSGWVSARWIKQVAG
jgi:hypothetical protein